MPATTPIAGPKPLPAKFRLLTTFGLGLLKPASGTWGSLPPPILAGVLIAAGLGPDRAPWVYNGSLLVVLLVFAGACILYGDHAEARYRAKDPGQVVADETAGQCLPLLFLPASAVAGPASGAFTLFYAFVAFRVLDIVKPWPARGLQRVPGGWGILLDDLAAGAYAWILVQATARFVMA